MDLRSAQNLARVLMTEHGLLEQGWTFGFDGARRRFGVCTRNASGTTKHISLSRILTVLNEDAQVRDVLLHEIAHALCPMNAGHSLQWEMMARRVGARPERCYSSDAVVEPAAPILGLCPGGHEHERFKAPRLKVSCGQCSPKVFNENYLITWVKNPKKQ